MSDCATLLTGERVAVTPAPCSLRAVLRCHPGDVSSLAGAMAVQLPVEACRALRTGDTVALWLGPDEWLLLVESASADWLPKLEGRVANVSFSIVDVSDRQVGIIVDGPAAEDVLASGCPLDLAQASFPVGACTRTLFHKAEIVLWRVGRTSFRIEVWRSFADYVSRLVGDAIND